MKVLIAAVAIVASTLAASAQQLRYTAVPNANGTVTLVPQQEPVTGPGAAFAAKEAQDRIRQFKSNETFAWTDATGALKGVFADQRLVANMQLQPGDSITAVPTEEWTTAGLEGSMGDEMIRTLAREAGKKLMQAARDTACDFQPRPATITPSVEISFGFLAGGSLAIEATWETDKLCPTATSP